MSGLGAGIRLALAGKKVVLLERHNALGGLNGYYFKEGIKYDVGLHAMTNFVPKGAKGKPLTKLCRQLRLPYEALQLKEQGTSCILFPSCKLRFSNSFAYLESEIENHFPNQMDGVHRLIRSILTTDDTSFEDLGFQSTREKLCVYLTEPLLIEMLLLPLLYYGSPIPNDIDWRQFVVLFKAIYLEGFARPEGGVRTLIHLLRKQYQQLGGVLRVKCGVRRCIVKDSQVTELVLDNGECLIAKQIFSSIGFIETCRLCGIEPNLCEKKINPLSFIETITILKDEPCVYDWPYTIVFYNRTDSIRYENSQDLLDLESGVLCIPENYQGNSSPTATTLRTTHLSNFEKWRCLSKSNYTLHKKQCLERSRLNAFSLLGNPRNSEVLAEDMFTPLTIQRYTGHDQGSIYGFRNKRRDGRIGLKNLFVCGTDQGFLGIVGALLSGISMANYHGLQNNASD